MLGQIYFAINPEDNRPGIGWLFEGGACLGKQTVYRALFAIARDRDEIEK